MMIQEQLERDREEHNRGFALRLCNVTDKIPTEYFIIDGG